MKLIFKSIVMTMATFPQPEALVNASPDQLAGWKTEARCAQAVSG